MTAPSVHTITADTWVKVATNITTCVIWKMSSKPNVYMQTYRMTGGAAPTDLSDAVPIFQGIDYMTITAAAAIDVYIYAKNVNGKVRVDA